MDFFLELETRKTGREANGLKSFQPFGDNGAISMKRPLLSLLCFCLMLTPALAMAVPAHSAPDLPTDEAWWHNTNMDRNHNKIGDAGTSALARACACGALANLEKVS